MPHLLVSPPPRPSKKGGERRDKKRRGARLDERSEKRGVQPPAGGSGAGRSAAQVRAGARVFKIPHPRDQANGWRAPRREALDLT